MNGNLTVHFLPSLVPAAAFRGCVAIVVDLLRASTTITCALAAGAASIRPFCEIDETRHYAERQSPRPLLGGERKGVKIAGIHLDNSPARYTADVVGNREIAFTTTNGTRALTHVAESDRVLVGAFVNLNTVVTVAAGTKKPVRVVCAGTGGEITGEDVLCAGAIVSGLERAAGMMLENDEAGIARAMFEQQATEKARFREALRTSRGGRNLVSLGLESDIEISGTFDRYQVVGEYFTAENRIIPVNDVPNEIPRWVAVSVG